MFLKRYSLGVAWYWEAPSLRKDVYLVFGPQYGRDV